MQLETAHLSGSPRFNEAFAARMSSPAAPTPTLRLQWCRGQSRWGRQCRKSLSPARQKWQESREPASLSFGKEPVFLRLCFCGLLPRGAHKSWQPTLGSSGRSNSVCVFERVSSSCLNGEGKSNTVLGDSRWQNDNFRVTFIRQSWMRQRKHMGTCRGTAQFLSHFNRAIKKPNLGSRNLTQKSRHGSVLRAALPCNKQRIIRWDKEIIFRGINYRGFNILTRLSASEAGMN